MSKEELRKDLLVGGRREATRPWDISPILSLSFPQHSTYQPNTVLSVSPTCLVLEECFSVRSGRQL